MVPLLVGVFAVHLPLPVYTVPESVLSRTLYTCSVAHVFFKCFVNRPPVLHILSRSVFRTPYSDAIHIASTSVLSTPCSVLRTLAVLF